MAKGGRGGRRSLSHVQQTTAPTAPVNNAPVTYGIFDDNDNKIANNILRKVTIPNETKLDKNKKKNNDIRF